MGLVVVGLLLIVGAVILFFISRWNTRLAVAVRTTELSSVSDLKALYQTVVREVSAGLFKQQVGLQGRIECEQPLQSELTGTACVAYRFRVERRWEEEHEERDSDGHTHLETRSGSDTLAHNDRRTPFWLSDGGARLLITPDGARLDLEKVLDRFEQGSAGALVQIGSFKGDLGKLLPGRRRLIGYHYQEEVLPVGRTVYVLGAANDSGGTLGITSDQESKDPFLISLKTRDQVMQSARQTATYTMYAAYACAPLGAILAIVGLLRR